MNKKTSKIFSIFWLAAGIFWAIAAVRNITAKDDIVGIIIYIAAAVLSLILAFAYYRDFVK